MSAGSGAAISLPQVSLVALEQGAFAPWCAHVTREYAADKVASLGIAPEDALVMAAQSMASALPQGCATAGNFIFGVENAAGDTVGTLWYALQDQWGVCTAFIYDIEIHPNHRRKGYGAATLAAFEADAFARGAARLALNVFAHNPGAQALYERAGYAVSNVTMGKVLV